MHYRFGALSAYYLCRTLSHHWPTPIYLWCTNDQHIGHIMSINYYYCYHYLQANFMMFIMGAILMIAIVDERTFATVKQNRASCETVDDVHRLMKFSSAIWCDGHAWCSNPPTLVWRKQIVSDPPAIRSRHLKCNQAKAHQYLRRCFGGCASI